MVHAPATQMTTQNFTMSHHIHACLQSNASSTLWFPEGDFNAAARAFPRTFHDMTVGHFTGLGSYSYHSDSCDPYYSHYAGTYDKAGNTYKVFWYHGN